MINYNPLWETLKRKNMSTYTLRTDFKISGSTIQRLKKNMSVSTNTLNDLCLLIDCDVNDIIKFERKDNEIMLINLGK